ncbi:MULTISPECIES: hypothetical protein [Enterococcus]|jgi:hypothetical protein|uniref:Uncharacterized protein n=1 Tax=Enterococcus moraviensis ATCC BAA-383 TaxID=1158609 RepID=R2T6K0_9ENTE|nr:hypothetical protein [Enterococcus moraviensis]EOI00669.1 hypothetical protein UAY_01772 [Enterococcus moraviensis ATCC BAA-383]EOT73102.1 hypothetical protein I586_00095 [Enterococcus moraviensis ATCC BAA-383]OJG68660.1 hypothetical protein RV09_GL000059 [Enterococcus moraviensis]
MNIKVKKINGEEFSAKVTKNLQEIFEELADISGSNFILLGDHIEQKITIESIVEE